MLNEPHMQEKIEKLRICRCESEFALAVDAHQRALGQVYSNKWALKSTTKIPPEYQHVYTRPYVKVLEKIEKIDHQNNRRVLFRKRICP